MTRFINVHAFFKSVVINNFVFIVDRGFCDGQLHWVHPM